MFKETKETKKKPYVLWENPLVFKKFGITQIPGRGHIWCSAPPFKGSGRSNEHDDLCFHARGD